jgi:uncharacterized protein (TIGR02145 family)
MNNSTSSKAKSILLIIFMIITGSCEKFERISGYSSIGVRDIDKQSATFYVEIGDLSSSTNLSHGVCWSLSPEPNLSNSVYQWDETPIAGQKYDVQVDNLTSNTTYYVRGFVQEDSNIVFSKETIFTTLPPTLASISIESSSEITASSAKINIKITYDGGSPIQSAGVCYNLTGNPSETENTTLTTVTSGSVSISITNLFPNQVYYIKAFANNAAGIVYSPVTQILTLKTTPTIQTLSVSMVTASTALVKGQLTSDGGDNIIESGIVWSQWGIPTIHDNTTPFNFANSEASFIKSIPSNTTVYARAYATNSMGSSLGDVVSFKTAATTTNATDIEGNNYRTARFGTQVWMVENLKSTKYSDNSSIPNVLVYGNDPANIESFGRLYSWSSAMNNSVTPQSQGACPTGWHLPDIAEWETLVNYLGGRDTAGLVIKDVNNGLWSNLPPNENFTNEFRAPAGGLWNNYVSSFEDNNRGCYYWTSVIPKEGVGQFFSTRFSPNNLVDNQNHNLNSHLSVRCVKDNL